MTPTQVKSLIDKVKAYVTDKSDPPSSAANMSIDNTISRFSQSYQACMSSGFIQLRFSHSI